MPPFDANIFRLERIFLLFALHCSIPATSWFSFYVLPYIQYVECFHHYDYICHWYVLGPLSIVLSTFIFRFHRLYSIRFFYGIWLFTSLTCFSPVHTRIPSNLFFLMFVNSLLKVVQIVYTIILIWMCFRCKQRMCEISFVSFSSFKCVLFLFRCLCIQ